MDSGLKQRRVVHESQNLTTTKYDDDLYRFNKDGDRYEDSEEYDADDLADVVVSSNGNVIVNVDLDVVVSLELECQSKSKYLRICLVWLLPQSIHPDAPSPHD
jgi:hypothetical protein